MILKFRINNNLAKTVTRTISTDDRKNREPGIEWVSQRVGGAERVERKRREKERYKRKEASLYYYFVATLTSTMLDV